MLGILGKFYLRFKIKNRDNQIADELPMVYEEDGEPMIPIDSDKLKMIQEASGLGDNEVDEDQKKGD